MGLFGNKKIKETNDNNKQAILSKIEGIKLNVRGDSQVLQLMANISNELKAQVSSDKKEVTKIDVQILSLLDDISGNVIKGASVAAVNKLDKIVNLVNERRQYCLAGGHLTKDQEKLLKNQAKTNKKITKELNKESVQSRIDKLLAEVERKQIELNETEKEFARLKERNAKTPGDASILAQGSTVKAKIDQIKREINDLNGELNYERSTIMISQTTDYKETLIKDRTISVEENQVNMETLRAATEKSKAEQDAIDSNMKEVFGDVDANAAADPFAETETEVVDNPFAEAVTESKKSFKQSSLSAPEMRAEIIKTKAALEKSIEKYNDKIDDAQEDLKDIEAQLQPLLLKRKDASPSECLVLDGQIDELASRRSGVQYSIKRYRQGASVLQEQMRLMEKLETQQDLEQTQQQIEQMTEGKFQDYEGLAMYLKNAVQESNEKLEEIGMAGMVADSEDVNMNTFSSLSSQTFDAPENKDETKYDSLMKDLGISD